MSRRLRAFGSARRWALLAALLVLVNIAAGGAWARRKHARVVAGWEAAAASRGMQLRIGGTEGPFGIGSLRDVEIHVSPEVSVRAARVELGLLPWQHASRALGVAVVLRGPLDTVWEQVHDLAWPTDVQAAPVRVEYTGSSLGKLKAEPVTFEPGAERAHFHAEALHVLGATFRDVHVWAKRRDRAFELRLGHDAADAKAPRLGLVQSPGEGVEWTLDIPTQKLSEWASRIGLTLDETWADAVVVGTGSLIVPESRALSARANLRFTVDDWHRPSWPEAAALMGRSGAIALRVAPGPGTAHRVLRVEVEAGLFSLIGSGELSFGEPSRLAFDAQGRQSCVRLLAHLPASNYRERVRAHLRENPGDATNDAGVRLELAVRAEAPRGAPLRFRWHLHAGCGLPELKEE